MAPKAPRPSHKLAPNRASDAGGRRSSPAGFQAEVELTCLGAQGIKRLFQRGAPRPPAHGQRCQAVIRQHDQLPSLVATDVLGHHLALVQDADFIDRRRES